MTFIGMSHFGPAKHAEFEQLSEIGNVIHPDPKKGIQFCHFGVKMGKIFLGLYVKK